MSYLGGNGPEFAVMSKESFTGDGSTTDFILTYRPGKAEALFVVLGGVVQEPGISYTVDSYTLSFSEAPGDGVDFYVMYRSFEVNRQSLGDSVLYDIGTDLDQIPTNDKRDERDNTFTGSNSFTRPVAVASATEPGQAVQLNQIEFLRARWSTWNSDNDSYSGEHGETEVHRRIRRCVMNADGTINYYLNDSDSTLKEDGTAAALDGTDGMVMVEIPKFWTRTEYNGVLQFRYISPIARSGYEVHPAFIVNGVEHSYFYYSAYDACVYDDSAGTFISGTNLNDNSGNVDLNNDYLASVSGVYPMVGLTRDEFRQLATNLGDGDWHQPDFWMAQAIQLLGLVRFGNYDLQDKVGRGNVDRSYVSSSSNQADSPHVIAGLSNQFGTQSGGVNDSEGDPWVSLFGIENFWGNAWNWVDGVNSNDRQAYVTADHTVFADDTVTNYMALGNFLPDASGDPIRNWQKIDHVFLPSEIGSGASTSAYVTDYLWTNPGWRVALLGGTASNDSRAGAWAWDLNDDSSDRIRDVGARVARRRV